MSARDGAPDPTVDQAIVDAAVDSQRRAADPAASVWVAANAGAGKTTVLVDRVTRLLLAGAMPHAVLCLTFTRAAAAEMLRRLGDRLGHWASVREEAELRRDLAKLLDREPTNVEAVAARRLFAATLDAPGGLRVQTIHSFCESLLKRFPVEAGLDPGFAVADDRAKDELLRDARDHALAASDGDPGLAAALDALVARVDETALIDTLRRLVADRQGLRRLLAAHGEDVEVAIAAMHAALDVEPDDTPATLSAAFVVSLDERALRAAAAALGRGSKEDRDKAADFAVWLAATDRAAAIEALLDVVLTDKREPRKRLATQAVAKAAPGALATLEALQRDAVAFVERRRAAFVAEGTAALLRLGARLLARYDAGKRAAGLLDYDDLIRRAARLLADENAAWVRYKLDGGIEHVLVDEAQDTSPEQWRVMRALAGEFFSGEAVGGDRPRTVFAVGDPKQSIFGFQGAAPEEFARVREEVRAEATRAGRAFRTVDLDASFRSTPEVLAAVDAVFGPGGPVAGIAEGEVRHRAVRARAPGLVELWPLIEPPPAAEPEPWDAPLDYAGEDSPPIMLAERIAGTIAGWIRDGEILAADGRPIVAGDVLILVQRRNAFFEAMVRALKRKGVPVAGADRLKLSEHIAVEDLAALGRFALLPDDDLTLACVLKGPLCGLDDDDLFALCRGRPGRLWPALRARAGENERWGRAAARLGALLAKADRVAPFEFYAGILATEDGRRAFLGRLGPEAADPIEEFLGLALADEREHPPSLEGFLDRLARGEAVVKRDMEEPRGQVRVMTVHAAKGLEAPIVFLPDTVRVADGRLDGGLLWDSEGGAPLALWPVRKDADSRRCRDARDEAAVLRAAEYRRLLYVAMTRARDRLYVCGWRGERLPTEHCWYETIARALDGKAAEGADGVRRLDHATPPVAARPATDAAPAPPPLPDWARLAAPVEPAAARPLAPFAAGAEPPVLRPLGGDEGRRFHRGRLIHRLLERLPDLPPEARGPAAARFLAGKRHGLTPAAQAEIAREALAVLAAPGLAALFAPGSLAEVAVVGTVRGRPVNGQVDRLAVTADEVLIVDYKSNRPPPSDPADVAPVYRAQMGLYRALLASVYPGRLVRCVLVWTDQARLMELPAGLLDEAVDKALAD